MNSLEILINGELYLANTRQFNDPFDGKLLPSDFVSELKELGYSGNEKELLNHDSFVKDRINGFGVLSLSRVCDDILMWSHYANAHKGICLGFKYDLCRYFNDHDWQIDHMLVRYLNDHPFKAIYEDLISKKRFNSEDGFLNLSDMSHALIDAVFTVKHSSWSYEQEERIISHVSGAHSFRAEALDHIVLGMNISRRDELTIRSLLTSPQWRHVRFFRAKRGRAALSVDICEESTPS